MLYEELQDRLDRIEDDIASLRRNDEHHCGSLTAVTVTLIVLLAGIVTLTLMVMDTRSETRGRRTDPAARPLERPKPDNLLGV